MSIHRKKAKRLSYLQAQLQRVPATPKGHKSELHPVKHPQNTHLKQQAVILINLPSGTPQPAAAAPARPGCLPARRLPSAGRPLPSAAAPRPLGPLCRPCPTPRGGPGGEDSSLRRRSVLAGDASPAPAPVAGRRKAGGGGAAISGLAEAAPLQPVVAEGAPALPPARSLLWWAEPKLLGYSPVTLLACYGVCQQCLVATGPSLVHTPRFPSSWVSGVLSAELWCCWLDGNYLHLPSLEHAGVDKDRRRSCKIEAQGASFQP